MDGETDWKLRVAVPPCQRLPCDAVSHCLVSAAEETFHIYMYSLTSLQWPPSGKNFRLMQRGGHYAGTYKLFSKCCLGMAV